MPRWVLSLPCTAHNPLYRLSEIATTYGHSGFCVSDVDWKGRAPTPRHRALRVACSCGATHLDRRFDRRLLEGAARRDVAEAEHAIVDHDRLVVVDADLCMICLLYTSPSPRDAHES
eukprot:1729027-Prymnesium_polylepis.1